MPIGPHGRGAGGCYGVRGLGIPAGCERGIGICGVWERGRVPYRLFRQGGSLLGELGCLSSPRVGEVYRGLQRVLWLFWGSLYDVGGCLV